jgi:D-glycero-D-manno-heptose 1,7-bisphosphate phosphatase
MAVINRPIVRDGKPYPPRSLEEFELLPGADKACQLLKEAEFLLIVATNQPDVGRGELQREAVEAIHTAMLKQLPIDRVMVCYHAGAKFDDPCDCRKPHPGMLLNAAKELRIDLARSFMIGDRWRDIECGARAGCQTIFIDWGYKERLALVPDRMAYELAVKL